MRKVRRLKGDAIALLLLALFQMMDMSALAQPIKHQDISVDQVKSKATDVAKRLSPLFDVEASVRVMHRPEPTPMGSMVTRYGECIIVINTNPTAWQRWDEIFSHMDLEVAEFMEFAAYHEAAHCFNVLGPGAFHLDQLPPGRESELFSDVFALAMMGAEREDFEIQHVHEQVVNLRRGMSGIFNSSHATHQGLLLLQEDLVYKSPVHKNVYLLAAFAVDLMAKIGHGHPFFANYKPL